MNKVVLIGRLTRDVELSTTANHKYLVRFCIAVDKGREQTNFIDIIAWEKTAEFIHKYFKKGQAIAVDGEITTTSWEDEEGNKRKRVEVLANRVEFVGNKQSSDGTGTGEFMPVDDDDDGLPFN